MDQTPIKKEFESYALSGLSTDRLTSLSLGHIQQQFQQQPLVHQSHHQQEFKQTPSQLNHQSQTLLPQVAYNNSNISLVNQLEVNQQIIHQMNQQQPMHTQPFQQQQQQQQQPMHKQPFQQQHVNQQQQQQQHVNQQQQHVNQQQQPEQQQPAGSATKYSLATQPHSIETKLEIINKRLLSQIDDTTRDKLLTMKSKLEIDLKQANNMPHVASHVVRSNSTTSSNQPTMSVKRVFSSTPTHIQPTSTGTSVDKEVVGDLISSQSLHQLLALLSPSSLLEQDVSSLLQEVCKEFVHDVIERSCLLAKHRGENKVDISDGKLVIEMGYGICIGGDGDGAIGKRFKSGRGYKSMVGAVDTAKKKK